MMNDHNSDPQPSPLELSPPSSDEHVSSPPQEPRRSFTVASSVSQTQSHDAADLAHRVSYRWDSVDAYRLSHEMIQAFLVQTFGDKDFFIRLRHDEFRFRTPRPLTPAEMTALRGMRFGSSSRLFDLPSRRRVLRPTEPLEVDDSHTTRASGTIPEEAVTHSSHCRKCQVIYCLWFVVGAGSLAIGLWRSYATSDESKGFTDAAYVLALGGLVLFPVQTRHFQVCQKVVRSGG